MDEISTELATDLRSAAGEPAESHQLVLFDVFYHELVITSVIIIKKGSKRLSALGRPICISSVWYWYGPG